MARNFNDQGLKTTDTAFQTPEQVTPSTADPAPLGLAGFGISTLLLSLINAGILGTTAGGDALKLGVMSVALTFGGLAQFAAGMWAFRRGNTFAATAFTSYGAFWFSFYLLVFVFIPQMKGETTSDVTTFVGTYLLAWGIFTAYMFLASLAGARAIQLVFILLTVTFVLLAFSFYAGSTTLGKAGGWAGLATAAAALYASFADVTNANFKRRVLPT